MTWEQSCLKRFNEQKNMCQLSRHNNKIILLDTDKVYHNKVGRMLKTNDKKYISRKVIKNNKNKLFWRHIFSYLDNDSIEMINQIINQYKIQKEVLQIAPKIIWNHYVNNTNVWGARSIVEELYGRDVWGNSYRIPEEEQWQIFDWDKEDICGKEKVCLNLDTIAKISNYVKKNNPKSKKIQKMGYYTKFFPEHHCCGILGNGDLCGSEIREEENKFQIDSQYHKPQINGLDCYKRERNYGSNSDDTYYIYDKTQYHTTLSFCGVHYNKYNKMGQKKFSAEIVPEIYNKLGYHLRNGYLCRNCN